MAFWHPFADMGAVARDEFVIDRGEGPWVFDEAGERYLDGTASLWCNIHGHGHPALNAAIHEQVDRISHTTMLGLSHPGATELAGRLVEIAPESE